MDRGVAAERLHPVFRGVFTVGHALIGERGRMMAAVLACGPGAVVSHRSAAALLGLLEKAPVVVDVIVIAPASRGRKVDGIRPHKMRRPTEGERGSVAGIPCTSPARTLVDLAGVAGQRTLRGAFDAAAHRGVLDIATLEAAIDNGRRRGTPALRTLIAEWRSAAPILSTQPVLRSPFEARVLPLLTQTDLPAPEINATIETPGGVLEVDLAWRAARLAVELDSRRHHGTHVAFERDRRRDRELMRVGYATLRPTWHQVEHEPEAVVAAIASHLSTDRRATEPDTPPT
jgi:uncharacterized protein DUF559/transcriptional regulator with AbiEi antitoxin domain of type IV toxin-antitoxin system